MTYDELTSAILDVLDTGNPDPIDILKAFNAIEEEILLSFRRKKEETLQ